MSIININIHGTYILHIFTLLGCILDYSVHVNRGNRFPWQKIYFHLSNMKQRVRWTASYLTGLIPTTSTKTWPLEAILRQSFFTLQDSSSGKISCSTLTICSSLLPLTGLSKWCFILQRLRKKKDLEFKPEYNV